MIEDILEPLVCERYRTDERYRKGHIHILAPKPGTRIIGLHTPEMKAVAKDLSKREDWRKTLDDFARIQSGMKGSVQPLAHDERMVWGIMLDYIKCPLQDRIKRIEEFLPSIDNWAICDNFCCNSKWIEKEDKDAVFSYIKDLSQRHEEFPVRVALVLSMCHFLDDKTIDGTFSMLEDIHLKENEPFYIRMGCAWLLATALAKQREKTYSFISTCNLPKDILKLYKRKARESLITKNTNAFPEGFTI